MTRLSILLLLAAASTTACAERADPAAAATAPAAPAVAAAPIAVAAAAASADVADVIRNLSATLPGVAPGGVRPTPVPGIYEVQHGMAFGYVTSDGKYLIEGDLIELESGRQLTEERRRLARLAAVEELGDRSMLHYRPAGPIQTRHTVTVFTDIDCGYCRKLHREMAEYNAKGIAVRYLFYPRSGPGSESFQKAEAVWCAANREAALTRAKLGERVEPRQCENPIMRQWEAGQELGLRGTPMIILPDGDVVQGYVPAAALAAQLDNEPQADPVAAAAE